MNWFLTRDWTGNYHLWIGEDGPIPCECSEGIWYDYHPDSPCFLLATDTGQVLFDAVHPGVDLGFPRLKPGECVELQPTWKTVNL